MAAPASGRVTGLAVDPSDPSRPGDLFRFNLDLVVERGTGNTSGWYADGFTGGVYVATNDAGLSHFDSALPAVQFEALMDDFANAQPVMAGDELSYSNSFECIPASVP